MDPLHIINQIAAAFAGAGFEIYEVGGSVRDRFLNRIPQDFDLTTSAHPDRTEAILRDLGIGTVYTVGKAYGTIGLTCDGFTVEVTTFRGEVYPTNSRKPNVEFGGSLRDDLARRDFTVGAIARHPLDGTLVDPFGGMADLAARKIRLVGGSERFAEDPLRMMRAVRLAVQLDFTLDVQMPDPGRLAFISSERISAELQKILLSPSPQRGIHLLRTFGLMRWVISEMVGLYDLEQGTHHYVDAYRHTLEVVERAGGHESADPDKIVLMLAALLHDIGKPQTRTVENGDVHFYGHAGVGATIAGQILTRLHCEGDQVRRVANLVALHMVPVDYPVADDISRPTVLRFVLKAGRRDARLLISLAKADTSSTRHPRTAFLNRLDAIVAEVLQEPGQIDSPLSGDEIMARFGLEPSARIGATKAHLVGLIIDGSLDRADKEAAFLEAAKFLTAPDAG
jgi:poly(A) polymerase